MKAIRDFSRSLPGHHVPTPCRPTISSSLPKSLPGAFSRNGVGQIHIQGLAENQIWLPGIPCTQQSPRKISSISTPSIIYIKQLPFVWHCLLPLLPIPKIPTKLNPFHHPRGLQPTDQLRHSELPHLRVDVGEFHFRCLNCALQLCVFFSAL